MNLLNILRFILNHPLNVNKKWAALRRYFSWQIGSRLLPGLVAVPFVNDSRLLVSPGMTGATGNIYTGLHEFEDMSFVLHLLRKNDVFVDVGANVGTYTVLAAVVGAKILSIEPIPTTFSHLVDNINLNKIHNIVEAYNIGVGRKDEVLKFTMTLDTTNHVISDDIGKQAGRQAGRQAAINVPVKTLDAIVGEFEPVLIKIDVEGWETEVIAGAERILSNQSLLAVIMELNGSGKQYGYDELALHNLMIDYGFKSFSYAPFNRQLIPLEGKNCQSGNTLYVRNIEQVIERIKTAPAFLSNGQQV